MEATPRCEARYKTKQQLLLFSTSLARHSGSVYLCWGVGSHKVSLLESQVCLRPSLVNLMFSSSKSWTRMMQG